MAIRLKNVSIKEYWILVAFLAVLCVSLSRYVMNGEPRTVASGQPTESIALYDGVTVIQPLTITQDMNWRGGHYALWFTRASEGSGGTLRFTLAQGSHVEEKAIALSELSENGYFPLPLTMTALTGGQASLTLETEGVEQGALSLGCGRDYYGFGETLVNAQKSGYTLAQEYRWHITDWEYGLRLCCYLLVAAGCITLFFIVRGVRKTGEESAGRCLAVFGVLTGIFFAMYFIYDSSILIEPTYAEAVSNFLKYAREESFLSNLLITDAGYLPLFQRLITLFFMKILRIPAHTALYVMQLTACLCCCMIWAFFVLSPFQRLLHLPQRVLFCFLMMGVCFYKETLFFTNFVYWGVLLLLLVMISDMERWNGAVSIMITLVCCLICLSKGVYVIFFPFMAVCLLLFFKSMGRREKGYAFFVMAAAILQMVYSFGGNGDGAGWMRSAENMGQLGFWFKLAVRVCVDVTVYFFTCLGAYAEKLQKILPILTVLVCLAVVGGFVYQIVLPLIRKEKIADKWRILYALVLFQFATCAFYRITVKSVPAEWEEVFRMFSEQPGDKYEIFSTVTAFLIWVVLFSILGDSYRRGREKESGKVYAAGRMTPELCGTMLLAFLCILCCPRLQLTGIGRSEVSDGRTYEGNIDTGWQQAKEVILKDAFFVPAREEFWSYSKNVTVYQLGEERYFEESYGVNLGAMEEGYRSEYTLEEDMRAENVIELWVQTPERIWTSPCHVTLLDAQNNVLQEAVQFTADRNRRMGFYFAEPVNGMRTMRFTDEEGKEVYIDDYVCWITAW